ncbi:amino acid ABC transporter permease [Aquabacter sp. CN5-332]|uniref:amino acid ABC transporter permease n=1 Tax=Aquabacter sp. CN5-332 TaxID=3156608 RepID=UPI0032B44B80
MLDNLQRNVLSNLDLLLTGLLTTIQVCTQAFLLATVVGLAACLIRLYVPALKYAAIAYIEFCRSTPMVVQLLWVNYVWPEVFGFPGTVIGAGVIALALQSSGYLAETFRSGIEAINKGHREAAMALGLSPARTMRRIVLPQVVLEMAPSLINQLAVVLKSSTLVSVIAVPDLMFQALRLVDRSLEPIEILSSVAILYIAVITSVSLISKLISDHFRDKYGLSIKQ